jgi:hypothetical protein
MKVRRIVVSKIHANDYTEESAYFRHDDLLSLSKCKDTCNFVEAVIHMNLNGEEKAEKIDTPNAQDKSAPRRLQSPVAKTVGHRPTPLYPIIK